MRLALVKLFDSLCRRITWRKLDTVLEQAAQGSKEFFFVQIGANDGVIYDPIHSFVKRLGWKGILVEPVKCYYDQLKQNYSGNSGLLYENAAIADKAETRDFYRIKEGLDFLPSWCNGLGTLHLDVLLTHKWAIPNIEDYLIKEQVHCITFESLMEKYNIAKFDLLVIDTEGHDYQILRQIDFTRFRPRVLLYEHQYINRSDRQDCEKTLKDEGYLLSKHLGNTLAYQRALTKKKTKARAIQSF